MHERFKWKRQLMSEQDDDSSPTKSFKERFNKKSESSKSLSPSPSKLSRRNLAKQGTDINLLRHKQKIEIEDDLAYVKT